MSGVRLGVSPGVTAHGGICMMVAVGTGMAESITFGLRDLLFLQLRAELLGPLMVVLSLAYCVGKQELRQQGKPAAAIPRPLGAAG